MEGGGGRSCDHAIRAFLPVGRTARGKEEEEEEEEEVGKLEVPPSAIPAGGGESSQRERETLSWELILAVLSLPSLPPLKRRTAEEQEEEVCGEWPSPPTKFYALPLLYVKVSFPLFFPPKYKKREAWKRSKWKRGGGGGAREEALSKFLPLPLPPHARKGARGELLR